MVFKGFQLIFHRIQWISINSIDFLLISIDSLQKKARSLQHAFTIYERLLSPQAQALALSTIHRRMGHNGHCVCPAGSEPRGSSTCRHRGRWTIAARCWHGVLEDPSVTFCGDGKPTSAPASPFGARVWHSGASQELTPGRISSCTAQSRTDALGGGPRGVTLTPTRQVWTTLQRAKAISSMTSWSHVLRVTRTRAAPLGRAGGGVERQHFRHPSLG